MELMARVSLKVATNSFFGGKNNLTIQQFWGIILKQKRRRATQMI